MYDDILIPTDGSIESEQAVSHGLGLVRIYDATVHALYEFSQSLVELLIGLASD